MGQNFNTDEAALENSYDKKYFLHGSWCTYETEELDCEITFGDIKKNVKVFDKIFKKRCLFFTFNGNLMGFIFILEELKIKKNRNKPAISKYKFLLAPNEQLLFCNRKIPMRSLDLFIKVFSVKSLTINGQLQGSQPDQMLLMYRQATNDVSFSVYNAMFNEGEDRESYSQMGPPEQPIPVIKKLSCIADITSNDSARESKDNIWSGAVSVELDGASLFHTYLELTEKDYMTKIPDWVVNCREKAKTQRRLRISS